MEVSAAQSHGTMLAGGSLNLIQRLRVKARTLAGLPKARKHFGKPDFY